MPIPTEIWLNGRSYQIEDCGGPHPNGGVVLGCLQYPSATILLNMDVDLEAQLTTLFHEAFHAFEQDIRGQQSEDLAYMVGTFVHTLFSHNREIAECYLPIEEFDDDEEGT